jgi:hypothetical protein
MFPKHHESTVILTAAVPVVFEYLDDFTKLSAHMEQSSGMMMGLKMKVETDARGGRAIGSKVRMRGKMMGITLALDEVVTERKPPLRKMWQTRRRSRGTGSEGLRRSLHPGVSVTAGFNL